MIEGLTLLSNIFRVNKIMIKGYFDFTLIDYSGLKLLIWPKKNGKYRMIFTVFLSINRLKDYFRRLIPIIFKIDFS